MIKHFCDLCGSECAAPKGTIGPAEHVFQSVTDVAGLDNDVLGARKLPVAVSVAFVVKVRSKGTDQDGKRYDHLEERFPTTCDPCVRKLMRQVLEENEKEGEE